MLNRREHIDEECPEPTKAISSVRRAEKACPPHDRYYQEQ